jgi:hypothetical protein
MKLNSLIDIVYDKLLSENKKKETEIFFISLAIISFHIYCTYWIITLVDLKIILINDYSKLLNDPHSSIYTFPFILILCIFSVPFTKNQPLYTLGKQYEINNADNY